LALGVRRLSSPFIHEQFSRDILRLNLFVAESTHVQGEIRRSIGRTASETDKWLPAANATSLLVSRILD